MFLGVDVSERRGLNVVALDERRSLTGPPQARVPVDTSALRTLDQIDAALAALTALLAWQGCCFNLGDPDEGLMVLPGPRPPGRYPRGV